MADLLKDYGKVFNRFKMPKDAPDDITETIKVLNKIFEINKLTEDDDPFAIQKLLVGLLFFIYLFPEITSKAVYDHNMGVISQYFDQLLNRPEPTPTVHVDQR